MNTIPKGFKIPYNFVLRNQNIIICTLLKPANDYPFANVDGGIDVANFQECVNDAVEAKAEECKHISFTVLAFLNFIQNALKGIAEIYDWTFHTKRCVVI